VARVLVDTNIIISALLFPSSVPAQAFATVLANHRLVLTRWIVAELNTVIDRKRPDLLPVLHELLVQISFDIAEPENQTVEISDPNDQPIIDAAIANGVDILVTGDKRFHALTVDVPKIVTAREFLVEHGSG